MLTDNRHTPTRRLSRKIISQNITDLTISLRHQRTTQ